MSHIVQKLGLLLFSEQINRSGVELESCSNLTSKHHHVFMRLLADYKTPLAAGGLSILGFLV